MLWKELQEPSYIKDNPFTHLSLLNATGQRHSAFTWQYIILHPLNVSIFSLYKVKNIEN